MKYVLSLNIHNKIIDPCFGVNCGESGSCINGVCRCGLNAPCSGNSDTCVSGVCRCGIADACGGSRGLLPPIDNTCSGGACKCGTDPPCVGLSTLPACLDYYGNLPSQTDISATCKVIKVVEIIL